MTWWPKTGDRQQHTPATLSKAFHEVRPGRILSRGRRNKCKHLVYYTKHCRKFAGSHNLVCSATQARNQLGTPGGAKSFLWGAQFFKLCPIHFSRRGEKNLGGLLPSSPLVTGQARCYGPGRKPHLISSSFGSISLWLIFRRYLAYTFPERLSRDASVVNAFTPISLLVYGDDHPSLPIFRCPPTK